MSKNSPSARRHRFLVFLRNLYLYETYGPLIGPKKENQPDPVWDPKYRTKFDPTYKGE